MGGNAETVSLAIHLTTTAPDCAEPTVALSLAASGSFSNEPRGPRIGFRLIRLDQARKHVFGNRGINQRGRMPPAAAARRPTIVSKLTPQSKKARRLRSDAMTFARSRLALRSSSRVIQLSLRSS